MHLVRFISLALLLGLSQGAFAESMLDKMQGFAHIIANAQGLFNVMLDMVVPFHFALLKISGVLFAAMALLSLTYGLGNKVMGGRESPLRNLGMIFVVLIALAPIDYSRNEYTLNGMNQQSPFEGMTIGLGTTTTTDADGNTVTTTQNLQTAWTITAAHYLITRVSEFIRESIDFAFDSLALGDQGGIPMSMLQSLSASYADNLPKSPHLRENYLMYNIACGDDDLVASNSTATDLQLLGLRGGGGLGLNLSQTEETALQSLSQSLIGNVTSGPLANTPKLLTANSDITSFFNEPIISGLTPHGIDTTGARAQLNWWRMDENALISPRHFVNPEGYKIPTYNYWIAQFEGKKLNDSLMFESTPMANGSDSLHWDYYEAFKKENEKTRLEDIPDNIHERFFAKNCYDLYRIAARSMHNYRAALTTILNENVDDYSSLNTALISLTPDMVSALNIMQEDRNNLGEITSGSKKDSSWFSWENLTDKIQRYVINPIVGTMNTANVKIQSLNVQYYLPVLVVTLSLLYGLAFTIFPLVALFSMFASRWGSMILLIQFMIFCHVAYLAIYFMAKVGGLVVQSALEAASQAMANSLRHASNVMPFVVAGEAAIYAGMLAAIPLSYMLVFSDTKGLRGLSSRYIGGSTAAKAAATTAYMGSKAVGAYTSNRSKAATQAAAQQQAAFQNNVTQNMTQMNQTLSDMREPLGEAAKNTRANNPSASGGAEAKPSNSNGNGNGGVSSPENSGGKND